MSTDKIPFKLQLTRVLELLAKQIYQSPLALLRENVQNAYDAVRLRRHLRGEFDAFISVEVSDEGVTISDNGVGMSRADLENHFWHGGSSSKNTAEARAAGVVGTFVIGAMANFGVAAAVEVETEDASGQRTYSTANQATISITDPCIEFQPRPSTGQPGTIVKAHLATPGTISAAAAETYLREFVALLDIPLRLNGKLLSQNGPEAIVARPHAAQTFAGASVAMGRLVADVELVVSNNADIWLSLSSMLWKGKPLEGKIILRSGVNLLRAYRSSFGLASTTVSSVYAFGGIADLLVLEPTAGREAITTAGTELLQSLVHEADAFTSLRLAEWPEADSSGGFVAWAAALRKFDLCGHLRVQVGDGPRVPLHEVRDRAKTKKTYVYGGSDPGILKHFSSDDSNLVILSKLKPRRLCEEGYLASCSVEPLQDAPKMLSSRAQAELTLAESSLAYRVESILESDYFVRCAVEFGSLSHGIPALVASAPPKPLKLALDPTNSSVAVVLQVFDHDYASFQSLAKDFVRTVVFSRVQSYVPSSTRQGAEEFLRAIRRPREVFEYGADDRTELSSVFSDYREGKIPLAEAMRRANVASRTSVQIVDRSRAALVRDVLPDIVSNEQALKDENTVPGSDLDAAPAILRTDIQHPAMLLTIEQGEEALRSFRGFIAISEAARFQYGEFFLQPYRTSVIWGGQKILFVFMHHSGTFGLYYDLQTRWPIAAPAGGGPVPTSTIVFKSATYLPIPDAVLSEFVPNGTERKQFEVRCDLLRGDDELEPHRGR